MSQDEITKYVHIPDPVKERLLERDEIEAINLTSGLCPLCRLGILVRGPTAMLNDYSGNINVRCLGCSQEYNVFILNDLVLNGHLLDRDEAGLYDAANPLLARNSAVESQPRKESQSLPSDRP